LNTNTKIVFRIIKFKKRYL